MMIFCARRCARNAVPRVWRGLRAITVGLVLLSVAESVFVVSNVLRYFGSPAPRPLLVTAIFALIERLGAAVPAG
ncbi:hypothetical protein ACIRG5_47235 [Lentzea sp. NPDC102401]|uniref:hypothetical protein n=1 Tax=Lentzea sp. NPDC102401 TaxID=3364128 RepID=UPI00382672FA